MVQYKKLHVHTHTIGFKWTWKQRRYRESRICSKRDSFDSEVELTCDVLSQRSSPLKIRRMKTLFVSLKTEEEEYTVLSL